MSERTEPMSEGIIEWIGVRGGEWVEQEERALHLRVKSCISA
jgi:hypothetical protein